ncbi:MAG TPA: hypothetical protein VNM40_02835 [Candidatus Paceibacterota bacterium]|nr:hypothetical protein [Candidatus Paceibacterota bacterium]
MQPLSPHIRRLYLLLFIAMFLAVLPIIILYADGWRYREGFGFVRTGGIFVSVPYPDADVQINGNTVGRSGFFDRSFYVGNLAPAAYSINVMREDYLPWSRVVVVEPQLVTDVDAFLFPKRIEPVRLAVSGTATTGVAVISRALYDEYVAEFGTTTASTTVPQDESDGMGVFVRDGDVFVRWMSEDAFPPSRFCGRPSFCVREFAIERGSDEVRTARFFRTGVAYATGDGAVYFAEADVRPTPLNVQLFEAPDADIRVVDDALIIKSGTILYEITL